MNLKSETAILKISESICDIDASEWNAIARQDQYSAFLEYEFLESLENSGSVSPEKGWYPQHFVLTVDNHIIGAAPAYAKTHSMGEFIFDQGLAQAVMQGNKAYYPKLVATLPFTPSPSYRFLVHPRYNEKSVVEALLKGMQNYRDAAGLQSHSILFADPFWSMLDKCTRQSCGNNGDNVDSRDFLTWSHQYFLWRNEKYTSFNDFAEQFRKNQRRNMHRERASLVEQKLFIRIHTGEEITQELMDRMYDFYKSTNENFGPWAAFFLNRQWFNEVGRQWKHRLLLFAAYRNGESAPIAMSMLTFKGDRLTGRYWGASEYIANLHFELCYYAPIEYAILHGYQSFDPGMGSDHKARRGFHSRKFLSYHAFVDADVSRLFSTVLPEANRATQRLIQDLDESIPWIRAKGD